MLLDSPLTGVEPKVSSKKTEGPVVAAKKVSKEPKPAPSPAPKPLPKAKPDQNAEPKKKDSHKSSSSSSSSTSTSSSKKPVAVAAEVTKPSVTKAHRVTAAERNKAANHKTVKSSVVIAAQSIVDRAYKKANTIGDEYGEPLDIHTKEQIMAILTGYRTDPAEIEAIALGVMAHEQKRLAKFKATHKRAPNYTEVHRGQQPLPLKAEG